MGYAFSEKQREEILELISSALNEAIEKQFVKARPDLKVDDKVMVKIPGRKLLAPRHFHSFDPDGGIRVWVDGGSSFTCNSTTAYYEWRLPTEDEV